MNLANAMVRQMPPPLSMARAWEPGDAAAWNHTPPFFIDNLLVRIHFIIVMIRWTGLAPSEFESPFPFRQHACSSTLPPLHVRPYPPHHLTLPSTESPNHLHRITFTKSPAHMCCGTEAGSYLRLIDSCIIQLKAQGPCRTCNESKEEVGILSRDPWC